MLAFYFVEERKGKKKGKLQTSNSKDSDYCLLERSPTRNLRLICPGFWPHCPKRRNTQRPLWMLEDDMWSNLWLGVRWPYFPLWFCPSRDEHCLLPHPWALSLPLLNLDLSSTCLSLESTKSSPGAGVRMGPQTEQA